MPEVVDATAEILARFYGEQPARTVRAVAIVDGDKILAVGGLYREPCRMVMFSEISDEFRADFKKRVFIKSLRRVMAFAAEARAPVQSLADPDIKGSDVLLAHLGFKPLTQGVWQWQA